MSSDESLAECSWCGENQGFCVKPHLVEGWCFSIKLREAFDVETVCYNAKCFFRN